MSEVGNPENRLPGLPRYLRVNTIKIGLGKCKKNLLQTGHHFSPDPKHPGHRMYYRDPDVPDLLVFKPKGQSDVSRIPMVASGEVVVQQKASCFPALALAPPAGSHAIDGCAAPGNKTSHLAALMGNQGKVIAFEMNERRCELLRDMMQAKGATIVEARHQSFLDAEPSDPIYANVTHILLDPSCSASGMSQTPTTDPADVKQLADDQVSLILHAMRFPALEALYVSQSRSSGLSVSAPRPALLPVLLPSLACLLAHSEATWVVTVCRRVYSTCSIYDEENEMVVQRVLHAQATFGVVPAMPWWARRGHVLAAKGKKEREKVAEIARCVVRSQYPDDGTIGFFLSRFERRAAGGAAGGRSGGTAGDAATDPTLDAKLHALEKARARAQKAAEREAIAEPKLPQKRKLPDGSNGADSGSGSGDEAKAKGGASSGGGVPAQTSAGGRAVPQWRLERDAKAKASGKKKR